MAAQSERPELDTSPANTRPIELVTENGFSILRSWEIDRVPPPITGKYLFLVGNPDGLERPREITVEIDDDAVARIERHSRNRIIPGSSFWIYCAERHLTTYLWEHDECPPNGRLRVEQLTAEDFDLSIRWKTT